MSKILYLHTNTTGFDPKKHGIWRVTGIVEIDGKQEEDFDLFIDPGNVEYEQDSLDISAITKQDLKLFGRQDVMFNQFRKILEDYVDKFDSNDKFLFCSYISNFDEKFIREWFLKNSLNYYGSYFHSNPIDVYNLVGYVTMDLRNKINNYKLSNICQLFNIKPHDITNALEGVKVTRDLFHSIKKEHLVVKL